MLYPQRNQYRQFIDLSGFWDFRFDINNDGLKENWQSGFDKSQPIAVPASWNDQFAANRDFLGPAWYQIRFEKPWGWDNKKIFLRFGSVNYISDVWLNGELVGHHEGGHLAFEYDVSGMIINENLLVVRVDGRLEKDHVPPKGRTLENYPETNYDFYPFCGIHRPVLLYAVPNEGIKDITVITSIKKTLGILDINIESSRIIGAIAHCTLKGFETLLIKEYKIEQEVQEMTLEVNNARFWDKNNPNLYSLTIDIIKNDATLDSYSLNVGIRTIEVKGDKLLLNGKPIYLKGFGRHEDFPITGRGYVPAVIIKDYSLMEWIGANSFRTTHYPYSEQMMDLADQLGFLVIDEIPAVGLTFNRDVIERELKLCSQYIHELIARDKNHPSVIMWSLANEPHSSVKSKEFFKKLYDLTKGIDKTRPITIVNMMGVREKAFEFCDVLCINRYYGWYVQPGKIEDACQSLSEEMDKLYERHHKPIILSEFGTGTIPGWHSQPSEMFSEEYQAEFIEKYIEVCRSKPYVIGEHVWNLCDFKTSQGITRMGGINYKGVFTRDRRPKMAAHILRKLWKEKT
ncbi:MAG: beta-glucuronidase [Candidatus Lokiarchaeota archaeon]|nr:beta-glucuronidase [Candidatus Lokiarchaeota archaeon]